MGIIKKLSEVDDFEVYKCNGLFYLRLPGLYFVALIKGGKVSKYVCDLGLEVEVVGESLVRRYNFWSDEDKKKYHLAQESPKLKEYMGRV